MNPVKGEAELVAGGGHYTLVMSNRALIAAEAQYGKPLALLLAHATIGFAGACAAMLYGALRTHHPEVTADEALELFMGDMDTVSAALERASVLAFPKAVEGKESKNPRRTSRRSGTSSGGNGAKRASTPKGSSPPRRARSS